MKFFDLRLTFTSMNLKSTLAWNTNKMPGLVLPNLTWVRKTVGPSLAPLLKPLTCHHNLCCT